MVFELVPRVFHDGGYVNIISWYNVSRLVVMLFQLVVWVLPGTWYVIPLYGIARVLL